MEIFSKIRKGSNPSPRIFLIFKLLRHTLDDPLSEECAYLVGKIMADGNLDYNFTLWEALYSDNLN